MNAERSWKTVLGYGSGATLVILAVTFFTTPGSFGNLPGDLHIAAPGAPIRLPIMSAFLISFITAGIFYLVSTFLGGSAAGRIDRQKRKFR